MDDESQAPPAASERRGHDRSRLILDVFFDGQDATGVASTKDIGVGGLYMNTQADLPSGTQLLIRIPLSAGNEIVVTGEVAYRVEGQGVGVRFVELSDDSRRAIERELANG